MTMRDWRSALASMIAVCAEQAKQLMGFGGELALVYKPAMDGVWGEFHFIRQGEAVPEGFLPAGLTLTGGVPYDHYETRIHGTVYRLPVIGAVEPARAQCA